MSVTSYGRARSKRNNVCRVCGEWYVPGWFSTHVYNSAKHAEALKARRGEKRGKQ